MLAVILNTMPVDISTYFDVNDVLDLGFLSENLRTHFESELKYIGINEYKIIDNESDFSEITFEKNENIMVLFSNMYFNFKSSEIFCSFNQSEVVLENSSKDIIGCIINVNRLTKNSKFINQIKSLNLPRINPTTYCKFINNSFDYKLILTDIINKRTSDKLPEIAQGVYVNSTPPKGDYTIIPPVFFGENVQIENGCVIGPDTIISDNCLIAENTVVKNSFIGEKSYISSSCYVENSVLCEDTSVCKNSALFSGCILGYKSIINEDVLLENNSKIKPHLRLRNDFCLSEKYSENDYLETFTNGLKPTSAALLGQALGYLLNSESIAIMSDGNPLSTSIKFSIIGGLLSQGQCCIDFGDFFCSSLSFFCDFCEIKNSVFIGCCKENVYIKIFRDKQTLTQNERAILSAVLKEKRFNENDKVAYKGIRKINGMQRIYLQKITEMFIGECFVLPKFITDNVIIKNFCRYAVTKLNFTDVKCEILFKINFSGNKLGVEYNGKSYNEKELLRFVNYHNKSKLNEKFMTSNNYDAVYLSFVVLNLINSGVDLDNAENIFPDFYISRELNNKSLNYKKLSEKFNNNEMICRNNKILITNENYFAEIDKKQKGKLKVVTKNFNVELAEEIAGQLLNLLE